MANARSVMIATFVPPFSTAVGVSPLLGRDFLAAEDQPNGPKLAVIAEGMWTRRFGRDPMRALRFE